jgi:O-acetyl-ADP-ribose deacetylase (regulator of RNase III)
MIDIVRADITTLTVDAIVNEAALLRRAYERAFDRIVACLFDEESVRIYRELSTAGG